MPHVTIEYTAGIDASHDMSALCEGIFQALAKHEAVPSAESLKIRTLPCPHSRIGTDPASFAHATLWLLPGRDETAKSSLAGCILAEMEKNLSRVGSLSVDVQDLSTAYTKRVL